MRLPPIEHIPDQRLDPEPEPEVPEGLALARACIEDLHKAADLMCEDPYLPDFRYRQWNIFVSQAKVLETVIADL